MCSFKRSSSLKNSRWVTRSQNEATLPTDTLFFTFNNAAWHSSWGKWKHRSISRNVSKVIFFTMTPKLVFYVTNQWGETDLHVILIRAECEQNCGYDTVRDAVMMCWFGRKRSVTDDHCEGSGGSKCTLSCLLFNRFISTLSWPLNDCRKQCWILPWKILGMQKMCAHRGNKVKVTINLKQHTVSRFNWLVFNLQNLLVV